MSENTRSIIKTGAILLTIGFVCTLLLSVCNYLTKDRIATLSKENERKAMIATLPEAEEFIKIQYAGDDIVAEIYEGKASGETVGYCVKAEPSGYGGTISMIVGVGLDGKVSGVDIVSMSETPGLGAKANDDVFADGYKGKAGEIAVKKSGTPAENEISAISGATITSKAVTLGVNQATKAVAGLR